MFTIVNGIYDNESLHTIEFNSIVNRIKEGSKKVLHIRIETIRSILDTDRSKHIKESLPAVTWSGTFQPRKKEGMKEHSGYMCLDFDKLEGLKDSEELRDSFHSSDKSHFSFISPSGKGVKIVVKVNPIPTNIDEHYYCYEQLLQQFEGANPDKSNDPARLCFLSHDPDARYNPNSKVFKWDKNKASEKKRELDRIERQIRQLNNSNLEADADLLNYIHPDSIDYDNWLNIITGCKEGGLSVDEVEAWSSQGAKHRPNDVVKPLGQT